MHDEPTGNPKVGLYRIVFEGAIDPTLILDDKGDLVFANRAARSADLVAQLLDQTGPHSTELGRFRKELETHARARVEVCVEGRTIAIEGRAHGAQYIVVLRDVTQ